MNDHDRLLNAIIDEPDDDAPRLVMADWLEENGDEARSEFIRAQCRHAALPEWSPLRFALWDREQELLKTLRNRWLGPLAAIRGKGHEWEFNRGFVGRAKLSASAFLDHGGTVFGAAPVREVEILRLTRRLKKVLASPRLRRVRALAVVDQRLSDEEWDHLADVAEAGVESLTLGGEEFDDDALWHFAASSHQRRFRELTLSRTSADELMPTLVDGPMDSLESLSISLDTVRGEDMGSLASMLGGGAMPRLATLVLCATNSGPDVAVSLAACRHPPCLRRLSFEANEIRDRGAAALADARCLADLEALDLAANRIGPEGVEALAASLLLRKLRTLMLHVNRIGDRGAIALAASPIAETLEHLELGACGIGPAGAEALAASPRLANLKALAMGDNRIGREGVRALAGSASLARLECLDLRDLRLAKRDLALLRERFGERLLA